jgi:hypothetical protein
VELVGYCRDFNRSGLLRRVQPLLFPPSGPARKRGRAQEPQVSMDLSHSPSSLEYQSMYVERDEFSPEGVYKQLKSRFDREKHTHINRLALDFKDSHTAEWNHFFPAWCAIPLRLLWCVQHDRSFGGAFARGVNEWDRRFIQDREVFGFFLTGLSALEVSCYGIYSIAAVASPSYFPIATPSARRQIDPIRTSQQYGKAFKGSPLADTLDTITESDTYREWRQFRNAIIHHAAPGRIIFATAGCGPPENDRWKYEGSEMVIDRATTQWRLDWLSTSLDDLQRGAVALLQDMHMQLE